MHDDPESTGCVLVLCMESAMDTGIKAPYLWFTHPDFQITTREVDYCWLAVLLAYINYVYTRYLYQKDSPSVVNC